MTTPKGWLRVARRRLREELARPIISQKDIDLWEKKVSDAEFAVKVGRTPTTENPARLEEVAEAHGCRPARLRAIFEGARDQDGWPLGQITMEEGFALQVADTLAMEELLKRPSTPVIACPVCGSTRWVLIQDGTGHSEDSLDTVTGTASEDVIELDNTDSHIRCEACDHLATDELYDQLGDAFGEADWLS